VLGGDFTIPAGYQAGSDRQTLRNQCYCHGDRHDPPRPSFTDRTARDAFVDYAYLLEADRLRVLTNRPGGWQPVAEAAWTERPDWDVVDQHAQHLRRGVVAPPTSSIAGGRQALERPGGHRHRTR
jgi:hypothetical protein